MSSTRRQAATPTAKGEWSCIKTLHLLQVLTRPVYISFVEFETAADLKKAVEALDAREFKDQRVTCVANVGGPILHLLSTCC